METIRSWFEFRKFSKRRMIISGVVALAIAILSIFVYKLNNINFVISAFLWGMASLVALLFPVKMKDEMPYGARLAFMLVLTFAEFILMQNTITCGTEALSVLLFVFNVMILFGVKAVVWAASGSMKAAAISSVAVTYIIAIADYIVVQARGFEIQFSDIFSMGTAAGVAGGYIFCDYWPEMRCGVMQGIVLLCMLIGIKFPKREYSARQLIYAASPLVLTVVCSCIVFNQSMTKTIGITDKYWQYRGSELNGFFVNMVYSASATRISEPFDYALGDAGNVTEELNNVLLKDPDGVETPPSGDSVPVINPEVDAEQPHVIVIMNETFSDIETLAASMGVEMTEAQGKEILPYYHSLLDEAPNIIKGHALASVYGGNTANSEFEFLTGMSMAFLPKNTVAYNFYLEQDNTFSIVESFNEAGYTTIGMHPENEVNWKRDKIYKYYGFDETYFRDDFTDLTDEDWYRNYVSDKAVYQQIIDRYEAREEGEKLFTFAITMQNHGGYSSENFNYEIDVEGASKTANEYFTSVHNADKDLEHLISYFEQADEEVIIVFFGDHQPSCTYIREDMLGCYEDVDDEGRLPQYVIPYMYWANDAIECDVPDLTSINFLSGYMMDMAGVEKSVFQNFVNSINSDIMAINAMGWMDYEYNFYPLTYGGEIDNSYLKWYSSLQYNALFDSNKLTDLFSLAASHAQDVEDAETTVPETDADGNLVTDAETSIDTPTVETDQFGNMIGQEPSMASEEDEE